MEEPKRLEPTKDTIRELFALSGNQCAYSYYDEDSEDIITCDHPLIENGEFVAQICHIEDAKKGGRFNKSMSNEARRQPSNLMIMCHRHHKVTDNIGRFPVKVMVQMKNRHEGLFYHKNFKPSKTVIEGVYQELKQLAEETNLLAKKIEKDTTQIKNITESTALDVKSLSNLLIEGVSKKLKIYVEEISSIAPDQPRVAIKLLEKHRSNIHELQDAEKVLVLKTLGNCYLSVREKKNASERFFEASKYSEKHRLELECIGFGIIGDRQKVEELSSKIIQNNPSNLNAYLLLVQVASSDTSIDTLRSKIPLELQDKYEITSVLGHFAKRAGCFDEAIQLLELTLKNCPNSWKQSTKETLASTIVENTVTKHIDLENLPPHFIKTKLDYAIQLIEEVIEQNKNTKVEGVSENMYSLLNVIYKILGDKNLAKQNSQKAYKLFPQDFDIIRQLSLVYFEAGDNDKSIELINKVLSESTDFNHAQHQQLQVILAGCHLQKMDYDIAITLLKSLILTLKDKYKENSL